MSRPFLLNQNNVKSFLLRRFVDLLWVWYLPLLVETIPTSFYWLALFSWNVNKQVDTFLGNFSTEFSSLQLFEKENRPEKFPFIATNKWIFLAACWSVNNFYFGFPIFRESGEEEGQNGNSKALCFTSKHTKITSCKKIMKNKI